ncbi:hypothetical protein GBA52_022562 [Prunus armeniaca]|nr:hypothetical protein GBA52_022562 [Prunus armeniaca]
MCPISENNIALWCKKHADGEGRDDPKFEGLAPSAVTCSEGDDDDDDDGDYDFAPAA